MNKNHRKIQVLAFLLSLVMIMMTIVPVSVYAKEKTSMEKDEDSQTLIKNNVYTGTEEFTPNLEEDILLRDAFSKHYVDPDGNRYAVIFPEQVHYSENDSWIEIDNSLSFDESSKRYVSNNERFKTRFSQNSNDAQLVSIEDGDYTLSWSISFSSQNISTSSRSASVDTQNSNGARISDVAAQVSEIDEETIRKVKNKDSISKMGKAASGIRYNGVFNNSVDLRYSILHGKVEEDVILNSSEGFVSYTLTVNTNGLLAVKGTDNSIAFVTTGGETIFSLGAPWMKDSYVSVSNDIEVSLLQKGNVAYITYTPSFEWLNDESRVYPVLIDPSFTTRFYTSNYEDTYVYAGDSASTTRPTETTMKVGNISGNQYFAYVKILNIPELVGGWSVDEATLNFWVNTTSSPALSLYEVTSEWSPTTITYSTQPSASLIKSGATGTVSGSNSKYSIDLTSWFDNIYYYYYDISEYFNSSNWNGFKIGYTTNTAGNYTQIYSSEYSTTSYRPTMTIKYTYWPYGGIEDGAVYSFVNSASNKYLTVDGGSTTNGTNVYQYTKNNTLSQAFRLAYDETNNCYRIGAMCSNNGEGSVLEVPSFSGTINSTSGYTNSNVRIYNRLSAPSNDQDWIIYPYNYSDLYMIVLKADPDLALTSCGTGNGSSSGTTATSEGNVFVSEFTGAANQLWKLESGGIQLINATNIKEVAAEGEDYTVSENSTWLSFCCPVTEYGDTVTWYSSNTHSVTVDSLGYVTTGTAGQATLRATVTHLDGTKDYYSCTIYVRIDDGTYYFNNVSNNYRLEYEDTDALYENAIIEVFNSGTAEPTQRYRIFKVKYLGEGLYSIRSMLDSSMGWTRSDTSLVMTAIGTSNDAVPSVAKWRIKSNSNGYYIHSSYGVSRTITSPTSSGEHVVLQSYSSANTLQNWTIKRITTTYHGVTMKDTVNKLAVNNNAIFTATMYSTYTDVYGQKGITWSVTDGTGTATINSSTGVLTGVSPGTVTVKATYSQNSSNIWTSESVVNIIPLAEGYYYLQNKDTSKYIQPDDGGDSHMEQHTYSGNDKQLWRLQHYSGTYYYLINQSSGKYLTAPESVSSGAAVIEASYSSSNQDRQLWSISKITGRSSFKIQSKNQIDGDLVLAVGWGANWNGVNVEQRNFELDTNYKDEWLPSQVMTKTINHYIDYGFSAYNEESFETSLIKVNTYQAFVSNVFDNVFTVNIKYNVYDGHTKSKIDMCKGTVDSTNVNTLCTSANAICGDGFCHQRDQIISYFVANTTSSKTNTNVLWSNNLIQSTNTNGSISTNRSCSSGYNLYLLERNTDARDIKATGVLLHETAHQFGAQDHYHEWADSAQTICKFADVCSDCDGTRPKTCIMYSSRPSDLYQKSIYTLICEYCKGEMETYIDDNFK